MIVVLAVVGAWVVAAAAVDTWGARSAPHGPVDVIVVAGCRVRPDGSPSPALARRTRRAVDLWRDGFGARLLLTGGGDVHTEAAVAAAYARTLGVPDAALLIEDASTTTWENAVFSARLVPGASVLVVTDSFHLLRTRLMFRRHFARVDAAGALPPASYRARQALREVPKLLGFFLLPR